MNWYKRSREEKVAVVEATEQEDLKTKIAKDYKKRWKKRLPKKRKKNSAGGNDSFS